MKFYHMLAMVFALILWIYVIVKLSNIILSVVVAVSIAAISYAVYKFTRKKAP